MWISEAPGVTIRPRSPESPRPGPRRRGPLDRLVEATPLIAILLIAALVGSLVWLADRNEREEARQNLIRDALWVEQALRFQISGTREAIEQLALDLTDGKFERDAVVARLRALLATHPEVVRAEWRDAEGRALATVPSPQREGGDDAQGAAAPGLATASTGVPQKLEPYGFVIEIWAPIVPRDTATGSVGVVLSLERLIAHHVPWWITQNNLVALTDRDGVVLASKSSLDAGADAARYAIAFDPPVPGAVL